MPTDTGTTQPRDGELLGRFAADRDEAAFAELVRRHGPMVLGVCRRLLADPRDQEDVFQAVFLVLAHKAGSVRQTELLAHWLHGVSYRTARRARAQAARRCSREKEIDTLTAAASTGDVDRDDLRALVDEEVNRLPERYRVPVVLCYLEGKTHAEAGEVLGCPRETVSTRLLRARELLRVRLTRRGLELPAALFATLLTEQAAPAAVAPALAGKAVQAAATTILGTAGATGLVTSEALAIAIEEVKAISGVVSGLKALLLLLLAGLVACVVVSLLRIFRADGPSDQGRTRNDIIQLSITLETFKSKYGFYPPSRFILCENPASYSGGAPGTHMADSTFYVRTMFPRWSTTPVAWSGAAVSTPPAQWTLEGDQCLVFFLGGIIQNGEVAGFGTNPSNPGDFSGGAIGPFYEFRSDRLVKLHQGSEFYSYLDPYGTPYAYFSSYRTRNGYFRYGRTDCPSLPGPPSPYSRGSGEFWNPDGFQLISAGRDRIFGPGSSLNNGRHWSPQTARDIAPAGRDDMSNFYSQPLGTPGR